jgi:hypothetical protein
MLIGAPPCKEPAAKSGRADCASASPSMARPTVASTGRASVEREYQGGQGAGLVGGRTSSAPGAVGLRWQRSRRRGDHLVGKRKKGEE